MKDLPMKTILKNLILAAVLVAAGANAQEPAAHTSASVQFTSGTDFAATLAVREYLKMFYPVTDNKIATQVVESQGKSATVKATFPGYSCVVELMKNESVNKYGWEVRNPGCRKL